MKYRKLQILFSLIISLFVIAVPAFAAAPDGLGPWADKVISFHQGLMKNGLPVPAIRSNPLAALGVAENTPTVDSTFVSLGFGGTITLGFKNGIKNGVLVVEATIEPGYPDETAKVEVSPDKYHWFAAGNVVQGGQVGVPYHAGCIHYVRITDTSSPTNFSDPTADGYDVDGVKGTGKSCSIRQHDDNKKDNKYGVGKYDNNYWGPYSSQQENQIDNGE